MAAMKFVDGGQREFEAHYGPGRTEPVLYCKHHLGGEDAPQLDEISFPPSYRVASHAHEADQIMFVTKGSVRFGKQEFGEGSSVYVPRMTLYSFESGPDGLTMLTYVQVKDTGAIWKDDFMKRREESAD
jgi:quercetin dioxygenase-like cupin family protein